MKTKIKFNHSSFFVLYLFFFSISISAQDYQRYIVDTLASSGMDGRGYVNDGSGKAAAFIAQQFDSLGLSVLKENYYQEFNFYVNTFPGKLELKINERVLTPGVNYLVDPMSGGGKGKDFTLKTINVFKRKDLQKLNDELYTLSEVVLLIEMPDTLSRKGRAMFMQTVHLLCEQWPVILLSDEKLTWGVAQNALGNPLFIINGVSVSKRDNISFHVEQKLEKVQEKNVIALKKGNNRSERYLIVSAHYDHLGRMGNETYFPGANDNASGVAEMLSIANSLKNVETDHSILFIAFAGEEAGLKGSEYFVGHPLIPLDSIDFVLNLDLSGTGGEGITVVNATVYQKEFNELVQLNDSIKAVVDIKKRGPTSNSDHYPFYKKGVPSFFIYTRGGIKAYHDIYDKAETLPLTKAEDLVELYTEFLLYLDKK